jgi:hypothetical protein
VQAKLAEATSALATTRSHLAEATGRVADLEGRVQALGQVAENLEAARAKIDGLEAQCADLKV